MKLITFFLLLLTGLFAMVCVSKAILTGNFLYILLLFAVPIGIAFLNHPDILLLLIVGTFLSNLRLPGTPGQLELVDLLQIVFVAITIAGAPLRKDRERLVPTLQVLVFLFLLNVALVMAVRGTGFRVLGDDHWGGFRYVPLVVNALFLLNIHSITMSAVLWKRAVILLLVLSFIPAAAELTAVITSGKVVFQYAFLSLTTDTVDLVRGYAEGSGIVRFKSAGRAGAALFLFAYIVRPRRSYRLWITGGILAVALVLMSLSGHRLSMIAAALFIWIYGSVVSSRKKRVASYFAISGLCLCLALGTLYLVAPKLPVSVQRTLSILPGIRISELARVDAAHSSRWRLDLWREALEEVPSYLLIGKGYTFPAHATEEVAGTVRMASSYEWAIVTSNYHNGPLSLIIGFGISGLIIGSFLLILPLVRHFRIQKMEWESDLLRQVHLVILVQLAVKVIVFYFIYGDAPSDFATVFFRLAILEGLARVRTNSAEVAPDPLRTPQRMSRIERKSLAI